MVFSSTLLEFFRLQVQVMQVIPAAKLVLRYGQSPNTNGGTQDYKSFTSVYVSKIWTNKNFRDCFSMIILENINLILLVVQMRDMFMEEGLYLLVLLILLIIQVPIAGSLMG
jgi:hypothetical protein